MMRNIFPVLALAISTLLSAHAFASDKEEIIFPEAAALIPAADMPKLKTEALSGSAEAAHRLATYYGMIALDLKQEIYWTQIRVENGDRNARYDLGAYLAAQHDEESHIRARYWLNAVKRDGPTDLADMASHALKDLDEASAH